MSDITITEILVRRERWIISCALFGLCALCWFYIFEGAGTNMNIWAMTTAQFPPQTRTPNTDIIWGPSYWLIMLGMWWIMMIAMMIPSASPMILLYARVYRRAQKKKQFDNSIIPTSLFAFGYLLCWFAFSLLATGLQWGLEKSGLLHSMMMWSSSRLFSSVFLLLAGLYQLSSLKQACLNHCRSPQDYLSRHWIKGRQGAFKMGIKHGSYCLGCCLFLMGLLFVGGVMNLLWISGLAIFVLLEKVLPYGDWLSKLSGGLMLVVGIYLMFT